VDTKTLQPDAGRQEKKAAGKSYRSEYFALFFCLFGFYRFFSQFLTLPFPAASGLFPAKKSAVFLYSIK
jgi:hypothetical protein